MINSYVVFVLIAGTRREEIARFSRAKTDQEFSKILKARTLGPEHSETQMQLRKNIRVRLQSYRTITIDLHICAVIARSRSCAKARNKSSRKEEKASRVNLRKTKFQVGKFISFS